VRQPTHARRILPCVGQAGPVSVGPVPHQQNTRDDRECRGGIAGRLAPACKSPAH